MILVDTSVWIDLLGKNKNFRINSEQLFSIVTCPPILQEIFQGIRNDLAYHTIQDSLLALSRVSDPVPLDVYLFAADIYRSGRKKGFTIRSSFDCLIAAIAIREKLPVWHLDRDFNLIAKYTDLKTQNSL